jgi:hypothetical protein
MALERFIPKSPDIFIRNSQDFEVAKFGHLNTIVEYINNNSAKPAGLNGYVQFNNNSALGGDAGLFWDNTNKRLGIGTVIPATTFQVNGVQALTNADLTGYPLYSIFNIVRNGATSIALDRFTGAPHFNLRAAGGTIASPTTQVGELGNIGWWSYSGTAFYRNVLLIARAENFVGGFAQTQRLSIGMGDSGSGTDYYYEMVNGNSYFGAGAYGSTPIARVQIKGQGSTSATTSLFVQNSLGSTALQVKDDLSVTVNSLVSFSNISAVHGFYSGGLFTGTTAYTSRGFTSTVNTPFVTYNISSPLANPNNSSQKFGGYGFVFDGSTQWFQGVGLSLFTTPGPDVTVNAPIERLRITSGGNVGIGTSIPAQKLSIDGSIGLISPSSGQTTTIDTNGYQGLSILTGPNSTQGIIINGFGSGPNSLSATNSGNNTIRNYVFTWRGGSGKGVLIDPLSTSAAESSASLQVKGSGSTSATTSLLVQNSLATTTFSVNDAGELSLPSTAPKITLGGNLTIANTVSPTRQMVYDVSNGNLSIYSGGVGEGYFIGNRLTNSRTSTAFVTPNALNNLGSSSITAYDNDGNIALQASNNGNRSIVLKGLGASGAVLIGNITTANGTSYSAILRADSTTQGFLPPRMTNAQRTAIGTPAVGLMVYCTDAVEGLYVYKSTGWTFVI